MIWFSSDHHFGHENVIKYCDRPYTSIEEMNEDLVMKWNEKVQAEDTVYYLGDFSLGIPALEKYGNRLSGHKKLVPGNHDKCHPICCKKKEPKMQEMRKIYYDNGFESVDLELELPIGNTRVVLHHMPYKNKETGIANDHSYTERYPEWRPKDNGLWLLHGHVHTAWKIKDKMINVGVDKWNFYPVSLEEIEKIITGEVSA